MPAKKERMIVLDCPAQLTFELVQQAITNSGLKVKDVNFAQGTIYAEKGMSLTSNGTRLYAEIVAGGPAAPMLQPNQSAVGIHSESKGKQIFDYGKNQKLIDQIEVELNRLLIQAQQSGDMQRSQWRPSVLRLQV